MTNSVENMPGRDRISGEVPSILMAMYYREGVDNPGFFALNICPHLISAFVDWHEHVSQQSLDDESQKSLDDSLVRISPALVSHLVVSYEMSFTRAHIMEKLGLEEGLDLSTVKYNAEGFRALYTRLVEMEPYLFDAKIIPESKQSYTPSEIEDVNLAFETAMLYKPWERFFRATGIPFAMEFDSPIEAFPDTIFLGGITLRRVFDRFLLPTFVNEPEYRNLFYTFFAQRYEQASDMKIKEGVFRELYKLLPGEDIHVLDAGCGTGLAHINKPVGRKIELFGIDASREMVQIAQSRGEQASVGRIEEVQLPDGSLFDHAMMSFVDYWITNSDRNAVFSGLKKVVKPGGKVVFNVHKPYAGWEDDYRQLIVDECGYTSVSFSSSQIERTGGGVYTAYYVVAEV